MILIYFSIGVPKANACTCKKTAFLTEEICSSSDRAFAGVIEAESFPLPVDAWGPTDIDSEVRLRVTDVWSGDIGRSYRSLQGFSPGSCGLSLVPGQAFVVCDDQSATAAPRLHACSGNLVPGDNAESLAWDLSLNNRSSVATNLDHPSRRLVWRLSTFLALFGVGAAAFVLRRRLSTEDLETGPNFLLVLCTAGAIIVSRYLGYQISMSLDQLRPGTLVSGGVVLLSFASSGWNMGGSQFNSKMLLRLVTIGALYLTCWNARPMLPIQSEGAVQCSIEHAELLVDELEGTSTLKWGETAQLEDRSCMNWGLGSYRAVGQLSKTCVQFHGVAGGTWEVCPEPYGIRHDLLDYATVF